MLRSLDCELESALLHLLQAEDKATMYHYPEEIREKIALLKRATYRVRQEATEFRRHAVEPMAGRDPCCGVHAEPMSKPETV